MDEQRPFRLFKNGREIRAVALSDQHWKVVRASKETGFHEGDEIAPRRPIGWQRARRRVNSCRSALSPNQLVLLRGKGLERSDQEVQSILRIRPWEPDSPAGA